MIRKKDIILYDWVGPSGYEGDTVISSVTHRTMNDDMKVPTGFNLFEILRGWRNRTMHT